MNILLTTLGLVLLIFLGLAVFSVRTARRIEAFLPPRGRFVDVPGARLHIRELGEAEARRPAILLVHGLGGQGAHFDYGVAQQLAANFRVIVVDRPGSGHSLRAPQTGADVSSQAAALAALVKQLGLLRPVVAGHSLGGAIALALALEHPEAVGALALVAPLSHAPESAPSAFRALTIETGWLRSCFAWTLATPASIAGSKKVLATVFAPEAAPRDFAVKGGGLLGLRPRAFLAASSDLQAVPLRLPQLEARYGELALPVAVLYGRQDAILDWRKNGQALAAKVAGARLELVEGGHMLPVTQPEHTADFVARVAGSIRVAADS